MVNKISFIVKTFKRYDCLEKLLKSLYDYYPEADVIVADDNEKINRKFYKKWSKVKLIQLPFDSGLSVGRNEAIKASDKEFILLLDDDFIFTDETDIEKFYKVINYDSEIGVVGGCCLEHGSEVHYEHKFTFNNGVLKHVSDGDIWKTIDKIRFKYTECVLNFALFRKEVFKDIQWDDKLKLAEHIDFYLRFKDTKWKVAYTPIVKIIHQKVRDEDYKYWRSRAKDFSIMMFKKHKIRKMITQKGTTTVLRGNNKLFTYKTKII